MKLLILSDSHTDMPPMAAAVEHERPDAIVHLGDHFTDARGLHFQFPDIPLYAVMGNTDFRGDGDMELYLPFEGKRMFMTHGHFYSVKTGLSQVEQKGISLGADITLFGHTHVPYLNWHNGMWLMNPGSVSRGGRRYMAQAPTYGVIEITGDEITCDIREISFEK